MNEYENKIIRDVFQLEKNKIRKGDNFEMKTNIGIYSSLIDDEYKIFSAIVNQQSPSADDYIKTSVYSSPLINYTTHEKFRMLDTTLIITSSKDIEKWKTTLSSYGIDFYTIFSKTDILKACIESFEVILISPSLYNLFLSHRVNYAWRRIIYHHPHINKISRMSESLCNFLWIICDNIKKVDTKFLLKFIPIFSNEQLLRAITYNPSKETALFKMKEKYKDVDMKRETCPICMDVIVNPLCELNCLNIFCSDCITRSNEYNLACPICKRNCFLEKI